MMCLAGFIFLKLFNKKIILTICFFANFHSYISHKYHQPLTYMGRGGGGSGVVRIQYQGGGVVTFDTIAKIVWMLVCLPLIERALKTLCMQ